MSPRSKTTWFLEAYERSMLPFTFKNLLSASSEDSDIEQLARESVSRLYESRRKLEAQATQVAQRQAEKDIKSTFGKAVTINDAELRRAVKKSTSKPIKKYLFQGDFEKERQEAVQFLIRRMQSIRTYKQQNP